MPNSITRGLFSFAIGICLFTAMLNTVFGQEIPIQVIERTARAIQGAAVSGGVPVPRGAASADTTWQLVDERGRSLPVETRVLGVWPDGSAQWVFVDAQVDLQANQTRELALRPGPSAAHDSPLKVITQDEAIIIDTGEVRFGIDRRRFRFFENLERDGVVLTRSGTGIHLRDAHDRDYWAANDEKTYSLRVERAGPLRAVIKAQGMLRDSKGEPHYAFVVRLHAYAGKPFVRLETVLLVNGDPQTQFVKFIEIETPLAFEGPEPRRVAIELDDGRVVTEQADPRRGTDRLAEGHHIRSLVQYGVDQWLANGFTQRWTAGRRSAGWLDCRVGERGVLIVMPDMWQLAPKELSFDPKRDLLRADVYPRHAPRIGVLNLARGQEGRINYESIPGTAYGVGLRTDVIYHFHNGDLADLPAVAAHHRQPPVLQAPPAHIAASGVFGRAFAPAQPERFPEYEAHIEKMLQWLVAAQEHYKWYGMFDYGDVVSAYNWLQRAANDYGGNAWLNGEFDLAQAMWINYARSGEPRWRDLAIACSRHHLFIDFIKPAELTAPDQWLLKDDSGFGRRHVDRHWTTAGRDSTHTFTENMLTYTWMSGDPWGGELALLAGDAAMSLPQYGSLRALGNKMGALVYAWCFDRDPKYLARAEEWIEFFHKDQQPEGNWEMTRDAQQGWVRRVNALGQNAAGCYMNYVAHVLERMYEQTHDPRIRSTLLKAADWWLANTDWDRALTDNHWSMHRHGSTPGRFAYAYLLSGEKKYLDAAVRFFDLEKRPRTGIELRYQIGPWMLQPPADYRLDVENGPLMTLSNPIVCQLHSLPAVIAAMQRD